jgi:hypothetical protein
MSFFAATNPNRPQDPSLAPTACEYCGKIVPLRECHSIGVIYMMPGHDNENGKSFGSYQCPDTQHFACCHEEAMLLAQMCMYEHIHAGSHKEQGKRLEHPTLIKNYENLTNLVNELVASGKAVRVEKE